MSTKKESKEKNKNNYKVKLPGRSVEDWPIAYDIYDDYSVRQIMRKGATVNGFSQYYK